MKIRFKMMLIGVGLTVVLMAVASYVSYTIFRQNTMNAMFRSIDSGMEEVADNFTDNDDLVDLEELKQYVGETYAEHPDETEGLTGEELLEKCRGIYSVLYIRSGILGLSQMSLTLRQSYFNLSHMAYNMVVIPGVKRTFFAFPDEERDRLVFLIDGEYALDNNYNESMRLPGSFYERKDTDVRITDESSEYEEFSIGGKSYKVYDVVRPVDEDNPTETYIATLFVEYDVSYAEASVNGFLKTELIALAIATVVLCVAYFLLAHFLFTKNLLALNAGAKTFTENMLEGKGLTVVDPKIKSKDEVGVLTNSFLSLERALIDYTERIENDAKDRARLSTEMNIAAKIQNEELPDAPICDDYCKVVATMTPAKEVGGDFYDYFYIAENKVAVLVADVTGKGIPAALFMMKAKGVVKSALMREKDLKTAMFAVNNALCDNNKAGLFVTLFVGVIDTEKGEMECVSAGHERPYLFGDGRVERLDVDANFVLGAFPDFTFTSQKFDVKGKRLFLFTDGLNESINGNEEEFGYGRIEASLMDSEKSSSEEILQKIQSDLSRFVAGKEAFDDVTLVLFESRKRYSVEFVDPDFSAITQAIEGFESAFSDEDRETLSKMGVVIDEVLNNVVSYEKSDRHTVAFSAEKGVDWTLRFSSNGAAFDPLSVEEESLTEIGADTPMGGFGIMITKSLSDEVKYERIGENNVITVKKYGVSKSKEGETE